MALATSTKRRWANVATVTLVVGETKTAFHVHEADLFEASPFFKAAFTSDFRESSERTMTLPEDDESIFELFVDWFYHRCYDIPATSQDADEDHDRYLQPVQLFVMADKYDVRNLKSLIVSQIFLVLKHDVGMPTLRTIAYAYEHISQKLTIHELLAGSLAWKTDLGWYQIASNQTWLRDHPDVSTDVNISFDKYMWMQKSFFDGMMLEEYLDKEQESGK